MGLLVHRVGMSAQNGVLPASGSFVPQGGNVARPMVCRKPDAPAESTMWLAGSSRLDHAMLFMDCVSRWRVSS